MLGLRLALSRCGSLFISVKGELMKKFIALCFFITCSGQAMESSLPEANRDAFQVVYSQNISVKYSGTQVLKNSDGNPVLCDSSSGPYDCVDVSVNEVSIQKIDDLQAIMALMRSGDYQLPLQFVNMK